MAIHRLEPLKGIIQSIEVLENGSVITLDNGHGCFKIPFYEILDRDLSGQKAVLRETIHSGPAISQELYADNFIYTGHAEGKFLKKCQRAYEKLMRFWN